MLKNNWGKGGVVILFRLLVGLVAGLIMDAQEVGWIWLSELLSHRQVVAQQERYRAVLVVRARN